MGEHLRTAPFPVLAVYGAQDTSGAGFKLAAFVEKTRVKPLRWARDHALPLKKMSDHRYDSYTPNQILKRGWTAKHQEQIPGGVLVVFETEALNATTNAAAVAFLDRVRANIVTSGRSGLPVALAVIKTSGEIEVEERNTFLSQLKKVTSETSSSASHVADRATLRTPATFHQTPPCALLVASLLDLEKEPELLIKFRSQIIDAIHDYYKVEIARIKSIKRGGERRSGAIALKARHEFKIAQYYEMRSLSEKALSHYSEAFDALVALAALWVKEETTEYQTHEIRGAAEIIHYRICALRLEAGDARQALSQLKTHLRTMMPLRNPNADPDEYWEWLSRQHVLFAGLISTSSSTSLTIAFGALDPCEKERFSGYYHLSRAATYAKQISRPERALDLIDRLIETNAKKRKIYARREVSLLISVAQERFRANDEAGALRDLERAAQVLKKDGWFETYCDILCMIDDMFTRSQSGLRTSRIPFYDCDREAQYLALYCKDSKIRDQAMQHLLRDRSAGGALSGRPLLLETNLVECTVDEGGRRALIKSFVGLDLSLKQVQTSGDAEIELANTLIADFSSDEPASIPANGSLLFDCTEDNAQLQNSPYVVLTFVGGASWKIAIKGASSPTMFSLKRSDSLSSPSAHGENHRRPGLVTKLLHETILKPGVVHELVCEGFPPNNLCLVGESFPVTCTLKGFSDKCVIEAECEAAWVKIHGKPTPGEFVFEIVAAESLSLEQITTTEVSIIAYVGTHQLAKLVIGMSAAYPLVQIACKRLIRTKCAVTFEAQHVDFTVKDCTHHELAGSWTVGDQRACMIDLADPASISLAIQRAPEPRLESITVLTIPAIEETTHGAHDDGVKCTLSFSPKNPWIQLGDPLDMVMSIECDDPLPSSESMVSSTSVVGDMHPLEEGEMRTIKLITEPVNGFFLSGPELSTYNLYRNQRLIVNWSLFPYEVGPQRLPAIWLEVRKEDALISRRRVECQDPLRVVLPESAIA